MIEPGSAVPDAVVWPAPRRPTPLREVLNRRSALLVFYLFDWSAT